MVFLISALWFRWISCSFFAGDGGGPISFLISSGDFPWPFSCSLVASGGKELAFFQFDEG